MHQEIPGSQAGRDPRCPAHRLPDDPGSLNNPYPVIERLRTAEPVVRVRLYERFDVWWVTSYAAAVAALDAPELAGDQRHVHPDLAEHVSPMRLGLIDKDPPAHTRLRAEALRMSSGGILPAFRRHVGARCAELVDALPPQSTTDLVPSLIEPLVDETTGAFLGLPHRADAALRAHADHLLRPMTSAATRAQITRARQALRQHIRDLPPDPGQRAAAGLRGDAPSDEWADVLLQMYGAGRRSTADFIATLLLGVLSWEGWAAHCRTPRARRLVTDEYLRLDGPIVRGVWRFARSDTVLAGTPIAAGDIVIVSLALADRDPAVFPAPTRLDLQRTPNRHLQFGHGAHRCIGVPLVHALADTLLATLARRFPDARTPDDDPSHRRGRASVFRGPARVPADLGPRHPL
ncbi:cytochrome P450 [Kitasatospora griseola]|uniref:Cytochrome P450 n=1 Tax=Kitasatospora griseola TaxID=2064 RepID=A0A0D0Q7Z7_KITGR|nr:cytochrome P450 [Kitasatospora griseola]KIQ67188.1 cytochrome P450 [Kitasatospora griseola]